MLDCYFCKLIQKIKTGDCPNFVRETKTGYVLLGNPQTREIRGYTVFIAKNHYHELHEMPDAERQLFLMEMTRISEAVFQAFQPKKLNYELLGNLVPHLHWHIFPRYGLEPETTAPLRQNPEEIWLARSEAECRPLWDEVRPILLKALNNTLA